MRKRNRTVIKADRIEHVDVAKVHNPRYLVSRDGEEVGIFPGYNALMAINAARKIYGPGKYSSTKTGETMYLGRGALETERREREERTARAAAKAAAKRDKIQLPKKSRTRRNAAGKADILQQGVKAGLLPAGLVTDLQRLEEGRFPADPARRANLLQRALKIRNDLVYQNLVEENLLGEAVQRALFDVIARQQRQLRSRSNPKGPVQKIAFKTNKRGQLQAFIYVMGGGIGRWNRIGLEDARQRLATGEAVKVDFDSMLTPSTVGKTYQPSWEEDIPIVSKYINPAEKDPEHPIEVTRHFRGGPPGYLSPWQKAMAIGQQELFDTGIKLHPRVAELRAARFSNPGATKPVYQSGLKQATAGQLPRLARVGLRVGRTPAEIRSDLATTGRFSAEQIRRAIDQATTAERRGNPTKRSRRNPREYDGPSYPFYVIEMSDPNHPYGSTNWFRLNDADRIKRNILFRQQKGEMRPGPQRFEIIDTRSGMWRRTGQFITIDPLTYQAIPEEENPRKRFRRNPPVKEIFETFNGRPATKATTVQAPRRTPGRVAQLGRLRLIRTADGRTWRFPGERAPFLAADSRGKLHVVGGQYRANPAGEECGEIEQIEYQTSKPHLGHDSETIYYHQLGEETGERPILEITPEGELQIIGGDYRIEADGIHN